MRSVLTIVTIAAALVTVLTTVLVVAQDDGGESTETVTNADVCRTALATTWLTASDACVGQPYGFVCNGGLQPLVEPAGAVSNSLAAVGSLVETGVVDSIQTASLQPTGDNGGIAFLRVAEPDTQVQYSALMIGDVRVQNVTPDGYTRWQSFLVETTDASERCAVAPYSSLVLQSLFNQSARVVVNGVSINLLGTVVIQTEPGLTHFLTLAGEVSVLTAGVTQSAIPGQEITVRYEANDFSRPIAAPDIPSQYRRERVDNLPLALFDRPVLVPQAGYATTNGAVNMRTMPSLDGAVILQVPAGERMTVLGRNPAGDWFHVRLSSGQTGWMFAELLGGEIGEIDNVYAATPQPVQRIGDLGVQAQVIAPNGVSLRTAPDVAFAVTGSLPFGYEVQLVARSPYSPWVKVDAGGEIGWVPLIAMETRAIVEALEIDYDVPPPPEPTAVPGQGGNAIPDPSCYPNC